MALEKEEYVKCCDICGNGFRPPMIDFDNLPSLSTIKPIMRRQKPPVYATASFENTKLDRTVDILPGLIETDPTKPPVVKASPFGFYSFVCKGHKFTLSSTLLKEIPYLESLVSGRFSINKNADGYITTEVIDPQLLCVILRYLDDKKKYVLLAGLPVNCDSFDFFELYRFLSIKPPIDLDADLLKKRILLNPKDNLKTQNELVDYALTLFYVANLIDWKKEIHYRNAVYHSVSYIFKDTKFSPMFKPMAKYHVKHLALKCVTFSYKQFVGIRSLHVDDTLSSSDEEIDPEPHELVEICSDNGPYFCGCYSHDDSVDSRLEGSVYWRLDRIQQAFNRYQESYVR